MPKRTNITHVLKTRIRRGDYRCRPFPSMVKLAAELEVDRRTAGKAMSELVNAGLLIKTETGRIKPAERGNPNKLQLALVAPAFPSPFITGHFATLERLASARGWDVHLINYTHDHDAAVYQAVDAFDALMIMPLTDQLAPSVINKIKSKQVKTVVLLEDHSQFGLPSLRFEIEGAVHGLLDHLRDTGRRRIACLNTQPCGRTINSRIHQWQLWKKLNQVTGPLINQPVKHFGNSMLEARQVIADRMEQELGGVDAILCTTGYAAIGVMRGLADRNIAIGGDVAVCAVDGEGQIGRCLIPSLTYAEGPQEDSYYQVCLDWFASDDPQWQGPLLIQPANYTLRIGQSTAVHSPPATQGP